MYSPLCFLGPHRVRINQKNFFSNQEQVFLSANNKRNAQLFFDSSKKKRSYANFWILMKESLFSQSWEKQIEKNPFDNQPNQKKRNALNSNPNSQKKYQPDIPLVIFEILSWSKKENSQKKS